MPTAPASALSAPLAAMEMPFEVAIGGGRISPQQSGTTEANALTVTSLVSGTACPTLQFMINTYVIKTDAATVFKGGSCTDIKAGTKLGLVGTLTNEAQMRFYATKVTLESTTTTPGPDARPVETEATVTGAVTGTCPAVQFTLTGWSGYTFRTAASTEVSGGSCADIKTGVKLAVVGTKIDTVATLSKVKIKSSGDKENSPEPVSGDGTVTSLVAGTTCPSLTFMIGSHKVSVSASTTYEGATCTDIKAGTTLRITGTKQADGTIVVSTLSLKSKEKENDKPEKYAEGDGVVSSVTSGASCPTLQFLIGTYVIKLDAATAFTKGACTDIKAGSKVSVKGTVNSDGSVTATRVSVEKGETESFEAEGEGVVGSLVGGSSCPALQFKIGEYTVSITASTTFVGGSCSSVRAGSRLHVRGTMSGAKSVSASKIKFED